MKLSLISAALLFAMPVSAETIRIATFNASMNREASGALASALTESDAQIAAVVAVINSVDPDVLLINEFDYDPAAASLFVEHHLDGRFDHMFIATSNTGTPSGIDLNGDGTIGTEGVAYAGDAFGFGMFEGQYGMLLVSRLPIDHNATRTFQTFLWADMPEARLPQNPDGSPYYAGEALDVLRLSSKSHWDVPVQSGETTIHILASHPTPPVFDGPEDRNGTRNADEIRFWADYIQDADYIYDDAGRFGGLADGAHFVVAGDLNADPFDGESTDSAVLQLLDLDVIGIEPTPASEGGRVASELQGGANSTHSGDPRFDTADFGDDPERFGPGNLRADYVLPSRSLSVVDAGIFWPRPGFPGAAAANAASDHRLVWIDVELP